MTLRLYCKQCGKTGKGQEFNFVRSTKTYKDVCKECDEHHLNTKMCLTCGFRKSKKRCFAAGADQCLACDRNEPFVQPDRNAVRRAKKEAWDRENRKRMSKPRPERTATSVFDWRR